MLLKLDKDAIAAVNIAPLVPYAEWNPQFKQYFVGDVGREHYRLMAYVASQLPLGSKIADVGTYFGMSALALSLNENNKVTTYDIHPCIPAMKDVKTALSRPNVSLKVMSGQLDAATIAKSDVILLDISHNGREETKFIELMTEHKFRGLLFMDDIHLNEPMRNTWSNITIRKHDITPLGHWSGTGVVVFDPSHIDVVVVTDVVASLESGGESGPSS